MKTIHMLSFLILPLLVVSCNQPAKKYIEPVNANATEKTKNLYHFIQDVQGNYTLSGQHNFCGKGSEYTDELEKLTGKKAIIWQSDFSFCVEGDAAMRFQHCGPANLPAISWQDYLKKDTTKKSETPVPVFLDITLEEARNQMITEAKKRYTEGHIITLMWHGCFPTEGDCCGIIDMGNGKPAVSRTMGFTGYRRHAAEPAWKEGADKIAGYLKQLQDADIPVLWRPYHEMNGVWFWWCNHKGDQGFKRLWIMMYEYFTNHHKLNNLIWVWNTNAPRDIPGDEAWDYELFYPGDAYVDILAADVYRKDYKQSHHDDLAALAKGKPIALGEVGEIPTAEILEKQPQWSWYMPWGWILFIANTPEDIKALIHSEKVLTLDEINFNNNSGEYLINP